MKFKIVLFSFLFLFHCTFKATENNLPLLKLILSLGKTTSMSYTIGGTVSGLTASGLVLQNNSGNNLTVNSGATNFVFGTGVASGSAYSVSIQTQPTGLSCSVYGGTGTVASENVTNISIICSTPTPGMYTIGGTVSGLTTSGLVLQNNNGNNLSVNSGATNFVFGTGIASGSTYSVTILTQPTGLGCTVTSGAGTVTSENVTNIVINCNNLWTPNSSETYSWGTFTDNFNGTIKFVGNAGTFGGNVYTAQTLTFMKCSQGQTWNSETNSCDGTAGTYQFCPTDDSACELGTLPSGTAYTTCNSLNTNPASGFAGNTIWRLPTRNELKTLIHCTDNRMPNDMYNCNSGNFISPSINNLFPNTVANNYWSSSVDPPYYAWYVHFNGGGTGSFVKTYSYYVRCVRGL